MHNDNDPIPLENLIEILSIYTIKLEEMQNANSDLCKLHNVLGWCMKYLVAYREGLNISSKSYL